MILSSRLSIAERANSILFLIISFLLSFTIHHFISRYARYVIPCFGIYFYLQFILIFLSISSRISALITQSPFYFCYIRDILRLIA